MLPIGLLVPAASAAPSTVVTFTFDNGTASQYALGYQQALAPHAMHATFFASSGTVGAGPGFMSWTQLQDLQAAGNEIGGRTTHFTDLTAVPPQTAVDEACGDRQALAQHGLDVSSFAYPFGAFNQAAEDVVAGCGYGVARTGGGIAPGGANVSGPIPPPDALAVAAYAPSGQITAADLESLVSDASAQNGGWIPVVIQNVCSQTLDAGNYASCKSSGGNIELSELNAFLDWLAAAGQSGGAPADAVVQTMRALATSVDTIAPSTTITCDGAPCTTDPYGNFTDVALSSTDVGSGVSSTHYTTDGSNPTLSSPAYAAPFRQSTSATIKFRSWDLAGNASAIGSQDLTIVPLGQDVDPPVSSIACNGAPCDAAAYNRAVTVSLSATDGHGSGVDAIRYTTDGSPPTAASPIYAGPFDVEQTSTVRFFATDRAGNAEQPQTQLVQITPAAVTVSFGWDDGKYALYNLAWQRALQPHNVRSTFYINSGNVGTGESGPTTPGFMTWANLSALYAAGNEIGGHTVDHINLVTLPTDAERIHQVCDDRQTLLTHGLNPTSFAYPEGALNANVQNIVRGVRIRERALRRRPHADGSDVRRDRAAARPVRDPHLGVAQRAGDHARRPPAGRARGVLARRRVAPDPGARGLLAAVLPLGLRGLHALLRVYGAHHAQRVPGLAPEQRPAGRRSGRGHHGDRAPGDRARGHLRRHGAGHHQHVQRRHVHVGLVSRPGERRAERHRRRGFRRGVHALHHRRHHARALEPALHGPLRGRSDLDRALRLVGQRGQQGGHEDADDPGRCGRPDGRDHGPAERRDGAAQRHVGGLGHRRRRGIRHGRGLRHAQGGLVPGRQRHGPADRHLEPLLVQLAAERDDGAGDAHDGRDRDGRGGQHHDVGDRHVHDLDLTRRARRRRVRSRTTSR